MTRSRPTAASSRAVLLPLVVALVATLVTAAPAEAARGPADPPRTGFRVRADGTAAGGWFGSRTASRRAVFRIDPGAGPRAGGFRDGGWRSDLRGSGPVDVDRWRVRRAAWLVSKYGTYDSDAQAAAVEAALDALLVGGAHRLDGPATRRRLRQTGVGDSVVALARYMLDASRTLAGPYRARVTTTGGDLGEHTRIRVVVTAARSGDPVAHLPVRVRVDGRSLHRETDDHGAVTVTPLARVAGPRPVTVSVSRVPSDRLFVRRPIRPGGSRIVVAGRKIVLTRRTSVAVRALPTVRVTTAQVRTVADPVPGTVHLADGYPSRRQAELTLHGPFGLDETPACDRALRTATLPVAADGSYPVPDLTVSAAGLYRWEVAVPADAFNAAATQCGQQVLLKAAPSLKVDAVEAAVDPGGDARARVRAADLPPGYARDAVVRLYGPFVARSAVRCSADREVRRREVAVTAPSTTATTSAVTLSRPGFYAWRATLPGTQLAVRSASRCGATGSILRVR